MAVPTFLFCMGEPWNDGLVIGPAADLALLFCVAMYRMYLISVGVHLVLSASSSARVPESPDSVSSGFATIRPKSKLGKQGRVKYLPSKALVSDSRRAAPMFEQLLCTEWLCVALSLPSDKHCNPRSSDHDLASCRSRLTTSGARVLSRPAQHTLSPASLIWLSSRQETQSTPASQNSV